MRTLLAAVVWGAATAAPTQAPLALLVRAADTAYGACLTAMLERPDNSCRAGDTSCWCRVARLAVARCDEHAHTMDWYARETVARVCGLEVEKREALRRVSREEFRWNNYLSDTNEVGGKKAVHNGSPRAVTVRAMTVDCSRMEAMKRTRPPPTATSTPAA